MPYVILILAVTLCLSGLAWADDQTHGLSDGLHVHHHALHFWADQGQNHPYGLTDLDLDELTTSDSWQKLLLLKRSSSGSYQSKIKDDDFFISGRFDDPKTELLTLLKAMQDQDQRLCRFIARVDFLHKRLASLGIDSGVDLNTCQDFIDWRQKMDISRLSLVFAEEDADNLAAAFAHVFIKGDHATRTESAWAINYTVKPSLGSPPLKQAALSVLGKNPAVFEILPYAQKAADYLDTDGRDLWEYTLNLDGEQVEQILRHLYEVKDINRPYFFTHENCATEIVRLVDLVRPEYQLQKKLGKIVHPAKIVTLLSDHGLIVQSRFVPAKLTLEQAKQNHDTDVNPDHLQPSDNNPINASPMHRLGLGLGFYDDQMNYQIKLRGAYQDWLDRPAGVRQFHYLELLSLEMVLDDDRPKLENLTLLKTASLKPVNQIKFHQNLDQKSHSYQYALGFKRVFDPSDPSSQQPLVLDLSAHQGYAWSLGSAKLLTGQLADTVCYALPGLGFQLGGLDVTYRLKMGLDLGCISHLRHNLRMHTGIQLPYYYQPSHLLPRRLYSQPSAHLGLQLDLDRNQAIRFSAGQERLRHKPQTWATLEWLRYF